MQGLLERESLDDDLATDVIVLEMMEMADFVNGIEEAKDRIQEPPCPIIKAAELRRTWVPFSPCFLGGIF